PSSQPLVTPHIYAASLHDALPISDIRGCRQTVAEGVTGRLIPPRDAAALADAILDLLHDDAKRRRFGQAARLKALNEFDEREYGDRKSTRLNSSHRTISYAVFCLK